MDLEIFISSIHKEAKCINCVASIYKTYKSYCLLNHYKRKPSIIKAKQKL